MVALLELDVTVPLQRLEAMRTTGTRVSLFAFVVHAIAAAIAEHPDLNLIRHGRRLVRFEDVDVNVPVEVKSAAGSFPREVVLRRAQQRSPIELYADLENARAEHARSGDLGDEARWARRMMRLLRFVPKLVRTTIIRLVMRNAFLIKRRSGTTLVTSVGKFASISGFAFTLMTGPRAAAFAVGGVVDKAWIHEKELARRSILPIAVVLNHDVLDGAPAARFATRLQAMIEGGEGL